MNRSSRNGSWEAEQDLHFHSAKPTSTSYLIIRPLDQILRLYLVRLTIGEFDEVIENAVRRI
jgi:hypothetical protein